MTPLQWLGDERLRTAATPGARWLQHVQVWRPAAADRLQTGAGESAVVLLSGTFDLFGGPTAWPARGARTTPFQGRPMAVFLPPQTVFRAERGPGEILLVAAAQPQVAETTGREALTKKPLLPLAGSGKAFDPGSGEWRPAETFPTAPESLPPRRMERLPVGDLVVERVMGPDYKAATLSLDEVVIPAGRTLPLTEIPARPPADELLLFVRAEDRAELHLGGERTEVRGDAAFVLPLAGRAPAAVVAATAGRVYALLAWAGKGGR